MNQLRIASAVFVAALVVVTGGVVGSTAPVAHVTGTPTTDTPTALQENNTTQGNETNATDTVTNVTGNETNVTAGNETNVTAGNETNVTDDATNVTGEIANVTFEQQVVENGTVTVQSVTVPEGGYVAIHTGDLLDNETVRSVIGVSGYLEPGTHENVTIELYANVTGANFTQEGLNVSETLFAMAHMDTNGNRTFDFVATNGTEDVPYTVDNETVTDQAFVATGEVPSMRPRHATATAPVAE